MKSLGATIRQIAADLISRYEAREGAATVILGAGASVNSGIPPWSKLAEQICKEFDLPPSNGSFTDAVIQHFSRPSVPYNQRYTIFRKYLDGRHPSIGYLHLAQLVKDGLISTVLTTNWDPLAELALLKVLSIEKVKILVRGELPDDVIAEILEWRHDQPTVVKLHGDAQSKQFMLGDIETRRFSPPLKKQLEASLSSCTLLVGQSAQDVDILALLLGAARNKGALYHVRYGDEPSEIDNLVERAHAQVVQGEHPSILASEKSINIGDFDGFFSQLDLAVQQELAKKRQSQLQKAERSILSKEKTGVGYINYSRITELVRRLTLSVKAAGPDLILFIDDPTAPGGMELKRRMSPIMKAEGVEIAVGTIRIEGDSNTRSHNRRVTSDLSQVGTKGIRHILILDAITFSGKTLKLARAAVKKHAPHATVQCGVLVISQQLVEQQSILSQRDPSEEYIQELVTDRHEIFFPWGVTQTTANFARQFEGATIDGARQIQISKRPWGTIEILADQETTSVRLLTIEAGRRLSFQRHLCRDELFVALDDNIGLDICADELDRQCDEYDERIKSLILEKGDYVLIPRGVWHRTKASMDRVRLLEVAFGLYDQDNDIERLLDDFERQRLDGGT